MPAEGNPDEAGQAGMQVSIHVEGGAAIVGPMEDVPVCILSRTAPESITFWNVEGTPGMLD